LENNIPEPELNQEKADSVNIEDLKKALAEEKVKSEANLARYQRAQADYSNLKRHSEEEKAETIKSACASLVLDILPVLGDYERALSAIPPDISGLEWVKGIQMIDKKLRDALEKRGVSAIQAEGQEFDPRFHEALGYSKGKRYMVIHQVEPGYKLNDRIIRPAKVIVGNGEE
jgi:molecular chaperone GrpE